MCTSIVYSAGDGYFGRNLDLEVSFGQEVVITPRDYAFNFRKLPTMEHHYAIIGVALVKDNYPLYFDGVNEEGVGMAGLNFDGPAHFFSVEDGKDNVSPFEFIPYVLGQCKSVEEAKQLMTNLNLVNINFSDQLKLSPLHWLIADRSGKSIVVESTVTGLHVYDNPVGVLTNNPEFPQQLTNLANYQSVSPAEPANTLTPGIALNNYSRGIGSHCLAGWTLKAALSRRPLPRCTHPPVRVNEKMLRITSIFSMQLTSRRGWTRSLQILLSTQSILMGSTWQPVLCTTRPMRTTRSMRLPCATQT